MRDASAKARSSKTATRGDSVRPSLLCCRAAMLVRCAVLLVVSLPGAEACAWGPRGHELVNEHAIATLPAELLPFFQAHARWLVAHASDPDDWIKSDSRERPHHFIDMERYARRFEQMPRTRVEALKAAGKKYVAKNGDLLWWLPLATRRLAEAMQAGEREEILHWAVAVAHYAADICQPLHTTENHNGQLNQQPGVHGRFETRTVNQLAGFLELRPPPARILADLHNSVFAQIARSYRLLPQIFRADQEAREGDRTFGPTYVGLMAKKLREPIQAQLEAGATLTGSFWLTAWVQAGRPDLSSALAPDE